MQFLTPRLINGFLGVFYFLIERLGNCLEVLTIKFINWEKYNIRSGGIKRPFWFSFSNQFFLDPFIFELSDKEKVSFIFLLCEASAANNNGELDVSHVKFTRFTNIDCLILNLLIEKLLKSNIISCSRTDRERIANGTLQDITLHNKTRQNKTEQDISPKRKSVREPVDKTLGSKIWEEYKTAYERRYGTPPVRNAAVNAKCTQIGKRLGEDAAAVASFFVSHNRQFYVLKSHPIGMLLADAEGLHTEWMKGKQTTITEARAAENKQQIVNVWSKHLEPEETK